MTKFAGNLQSSPVLKGGLAKVKRLSSFFSAVKREWLFPVTVQPGGNPIPLVKHDIQSDRQVKRVPRGQLPLSLVQLYLTYKLYH